MPTSWWRQTDKKFGSAGPFDEYVCYDNLASSSDFLMSQCWHSASDNLPLNSGDSKHFVIMLLRIKSQSATAHTVDDSLALLRPPDLHPMQSNSISRARISSVWIPDSVTHSSCSAKKFSSDLRQKFQLSRQWTTHSTEWLTWTFNAQTDLLSKSVNLLR